MNDTGDEWGAAAEWYPEVATAGDARLAWQNEFDRLGLPFEARETEPGRPRSAVAENGDRQVNLVLNPWRREFWLYLRTPRWPYSRAGQVVEPTDAAGALLLVLAELPG